MKILVSNDDGIDAFGINALAARIALDPQIQVYVCAPDRERSATGHALTLHKPLRVSEYKLEGNIKGSWSTSGTPSDCVKFAVDVLLDGKPDLVLSGINHGPNLGSEVLYSGTVSAAMEGAILGIPSIATSLVGRGKRRFDVAAEFIARFIRELPSSGISSHTLLNVNVPNIAPEDVKGVKLTELGIRKYDDYYEKRVDPRGQDYYWLSGEAIEGNEPENTDAWAVLHGYISITPVTFDMTDRGTLTKLKNWKGMEKLAWRPMAALPKQVGEKHKLEPYDLIKD